MNNENIIHLQDAHVTQFTNIDGRSAWKVRKNLTSEDLANLPGELTESQVFKILEFARHFELTAFNEGIKHGKKISNATFKPMLLQMMNNIKAAREENERLATRLEKFYTEG